MRDACVELIWEFAIFDLRMFLDFTELSCFPISCKFARKKRIETEAQSRRGDFQ